MRAARAEAFRERTFRLRCSRGHAEHFASRHKTLFSYVQPPTQFFSSRDGTWLSATRPTGRGPVEFVAKRSLVEPGATFQASATEWLPGKVATARWVEVHGVSGSLFKASTPEEEPRHVAVRPPAPFTGFGKYLRDVHRMRGNLTARLPGLRVRIASRQTQAGVCVLTRRMVERVCSQHCVP